MAWSLTRTKSSMRFHVLTVSCVCRTELCLLVRQFSLAILFSGSFGIAMPRGGGFLGRLSVDWADSDSGAFSRVVGKEGQSQNQRGQIASLATRIVNPAQTVQHTTARRETGWSGHENMFGNWISRNWRIGHCHRRLNTRSFGTLRGQGSCHGLSWPSLVPKRNVLLLPSEVVRLWLRITTDPFPDA